MKRKSEKAQKKFALIKELKNKGKSKREISSQTSLSMSYINQVFVAIEKGNNSLEEYQNDIIKRKINPETERPYSDRIEYSDHMARLRGYNNLSAYVMVRKAMKKEKSGSDELIELKPIDDLENIPSSCPQRYIELREAIDKLPEREKKIIVSLYFEGENRQQISESLDLSRERVRQLEIDALIRLRQNLEIETTPLTYRETLFAVTLSRLEEYGGNYKKIAEWMNENLGNGQGLYNELTVRYLLMPNNRKKAKEKFNKKKQQLEQ